MKSEYKNENPSCSLEQIPSCLGQDTRGYCSFCGEISFGSQQGPLLLQRDSYKNESRVVEFRKINSDPRKHTHNIKQLSF